MARRRFFVDEISRSRAVLGGEDALHLARVLRAEAGQRFEISDNQAVYLAEIESLRKDEVCFRVLEPLPPRSPEARLVLLAALIKFDRFEWMIEKATELGVAGFVPVIAERSERGLDRAAEKRGGRWRRIAREASQQARRVTLPEIFPAAKLETALGSAADYGYWLEEQAGASPILRALPEQAKRLPTDSIALLAGPEGGWTDAERALAGCSRFQPVSLGANILRAETAAIAALAILGNAWR